MASYIPSSVNPLQQNLQQNLLVSKKIHSTQVIKGRKGEYFADKNLFPFYLPNYLGVFCVLKVINKGSQCEKREFSYIVLHEIVAYKPYHHSKSFFKIKFATVYGLSAGSHISMRVHIYLCKINRDYRQSVTKFLASYGVIYSDD